MDLKSKLGTVMMIIILCLCFSQTVSARELIVVASESAQETSLNWFGFLETKEIPFKVVTPESFNDHKRETYIVIMGEIEKNEQLKKIAGEALSSKELKSIGKEGKGETFFKSNVWAPRQKVILFLGTDQASADNARKASKDHWYGMFMDWFDLEGTEGLHMY
jgi:hypothetical protein